MRRAAIAVPFVLLVSTALPAFTFVLHVGAQAGALEPKASVGLKPLTEMTANDRYKGEDGGLYGGGKNEPPDAHLKAARSEAMKIEPLDANGKPQFIHSGTYEELIEAFALTPSAIAAAITHRMESGVSGD